MNLKLRQTAVVCAGGAALVGGPGRSGRPGAQHTRHGHGHGGQEIRHTHIDMGKKGKSVGDVDVYTSLIYNKRITPRAIGRATMLCTAVSSSNQSCSATYFLPQGEIVVQGVIGSRLIYRSPWSAARDCTTTSAAR